MQTASHDKSAPFLTPRQAARLARVTPDTATRWCVSMNIGFRDERGWWRVDLNKLKAVIKAREVLGLIEPTEADAA
jgi:hypothetical protein